MQAIKKLKSLHFKEWRRRSTAPDYAYPRPTYSDKNANGLTKCIIDFLNFSGCQAERISSEGKVVDNRQTYTDCIGRAKTIGSVQRTYSSTTNGTADISATIKGLSVKIEVKVGRDKQSEAQKRYQEAIEKAGGIYVIAKTFEGFYGWFINEFRAREGGGDE
jgi:hypothetical protein